MTLRAYDLRTRRPRNALQGCPAPKKVDSAHSASLNFQFVIPPEDTFFTASSPTPTPSHAVKFGDAPLCKVVIGRAMTSRAFHLRTRCPRSAVQGRLAPTKAVSAHSQSLNFQTSSLSDPEDTSFTASSPTPTPLRAAK